MKRIIIATFVFGVLCATAFAGGGLDVFLGDLNAQARVDLPGFSARIGAQFGVPVPQVQVVLGAVAAPADAFLVFQLGQWSHRPPEEVLGVYKANRGKGWGVIAKSLGIKPGSSEFHALKRGNLALQGAPYGGPGKGHGNGKGKGHNK
jgi:hypothetical protein